MTTIEIKGEKMRQAVKWISESLREKDERPLAVLIQEAGARFNLSPKEEEFLVSFYQENKV